MHSRAFACGRKEVVESLYRLTTFWAAPIPAFAAMIFCSVSPMSGRRSNSEECGPARISSGILYSAAAMPRVRPTGHQWLVR